MSLFTIDAGKCNKDKICVMECPIQIIKMSSETGLPEPVQGAEQLCINCGHCVAVCPTGAFNHSKMGADQCEPMKTGWNPGSETVRNYMIARRSIRKYRKTPVEREKLEYIISTATYAPTGHNSRPVNWIVIPEREKVKEISSIVIDWMKQVKSENPDMARAWNFDLIIKAWENGIDSVTREAPALILVHGVKADPNASTACIIAASHAELAAPAVELGCCWGGYITWCSSMWKPLMEKLDLPKGHSLFGTLFVGYPQFKYHRVPKRDSAVVWK